MTMTGEMISARQTGRAVLMAVISAGFLAAAGCSSANPEHEYPEQIGGSDQHDPLGRSTNTDAEVGSLLDDDGLVGGIFKGDKEEKQEDAGQPGAGEEDAGEEKSPKAEEEEQVDAAQPSPEDANAEEEKLARVEEKAGDDARQVQYNPKKLGVNSYLWRATLDTLSFMPLASADPFGGVIITDWHANPQVPRERFKVTVYILDKKLRADGVRVSVFRQVRSDQGVWVDQAPAEDTGTKIENAILTRARQLRVAELKDD